MNGRESVETALRLFNDMVGDGVIEKYVVGGAMAALYYAEPFETEDLDLFIVLEQRGLILDLGPVYAYLAERGYRTRPDGKLDVEGLPVDILVAGENLTEEAVEKARKADFGGIPVRIMRLEHLLAIMTKLGRPKDQVRIPVIVSTAKINRKSLNEILRRHKLFDRWKRFAP